MNRTTKILLLAAFIFICINEISSHPETETTGYFKRPKRNPKPQFFSGTLFNPPKVNQALYQTVKDEVGKCKPATAIGGAVGGAIGGAAGGPGGACLGALGGAVGGCVTDIINNRPSNNQTG